MSGHSKWSTIKRKKEKTDSARAKVFTKMGREISVAVKIGGPDISKNSRLKDVVAKAKANNVPNSNIERIIKKAAGESSKQSYENIVYEGYGPCGVAVIVYGLTDNKNRTAANVRHYFDKFGGNLGAKGCVGFLFERKGIIYLEIEKSDEDGLMDFCVKNSALDFEVDGDIARIVFECDGFYDFVDKLKEKGYKFLSANIEEVPSNFVEVTDEEALKKLRKMVECFEEDDDIQEIYTNCKDF